MKKEFRTAQTPRTTVVFGSEDSKGVFWGVEFAPGEKDGAMSRHCHGWHASISNNGRATVWPSTNEEAADEADALLKEAMERKDRLCLCTGWMNHYIGVRLGLCAMDVRCQPEVELEELRRFLYLTNRLFDDQQFQVGPIHVMLMHDVEGFHVGWRVSAFGASTIIEA
jgi:hypothetical protein